MNIKSRIKKIERATGINRFNSRFCPCYGSKTLTIELKPMTIAEWNRRFDAGEPLEERLPDFCDECKKPIDKSRIKQAFEQYFEEKEKRLNEIWKRYLSHQV